MAKLSNLPGVFVTKLDGNIRVIDAIPSNITLIVGTSPAGPTDAIYLVADVSSAEGVFDPSATNTGTLMRGMHEALDAGAPYVALYRLGAAKAYIDFLGPYKIEPLYGGDSTLEDFKYYYYHTTNSLKIYDATSDLLVYDNSTSAPVDLGRVVVSESHIGLAGSADFASFVDVNATPMTLAQLKAYLITDGVDSSANAISGTLTQATNEIVFDSSSGSHSILVEGIAEGAVITLTSGGAITANDGTYEILSATTSGTITTCKVRKISDFTAERAFDTTRDAVSFADNSAADDVFTDGLIQLGIYEGSNGLNMTYEQKYEQLANAYWNLESAKVDAVVPMDIYLDAPNVINNAGAFSTPIVSDFLGELIQEEYEGSLAFMWDNNNSGKAERVSLPYSIGLSGSGAANYITALDQSAAVSAAGGTETVTFHEINFAHQLGEYLHNLSEDDNEAIGFIGVLPPANFSKSGISTWLGKSPVFNAADGTMIDNGSGLLGNRFMAGTVSIAKGIVHTASGYVDGTWLKDANGHFIEIGRHLAVVAQYARYVGVFGSTAYIANAAASYAGMVMSLDSKSAPTNKQIQTSITLPFSLHKKYLDGLVGSHYTIFAVRAAGGIKVVDAPTAATEDSDWRRLATVRVASDVVEIVRAIADPYVGNLFNSAVRGALEEQINSRLVELQGGGYLDAAFAKISQSRNQSILGEADVKLVLQIPGELRRLQITLALTA